MIWVLMIDATLKKFAREHEGFLGIWESLNAQGLLTETICTFVIKLFHHRKQLTCFKMSNKSIASELYFKDYNISIDKVKLTINSGENSLTFNLKRVKLYRLGVFKLKNNTELRIY